MLRSYSSSSIPPDLPTRTMKTNQSGLTLLTNHSAHTSTPNFQDNTQNLHYLLKQSKLTNTHLYNTLFHTNIPLDEQQKQSLIKRFVALQNMIIGLMKKNDMYLGSGTSSYLMDNVENQLMGLLNQKQREIYGLQRKVWNYQVRVREGMDREGRLMRELEDIKGILVKMEGKTGGISGHDIKGYFNVKEEIKQLTQQNHKLKQNITALTSLFQQELQTLQKSGLKPQFQPQLQTILENPLHNKLQQIDNIIFVSPPYFNNIAAPSLSPSLQPSSLQPSKSNILHKLAKTLKNLLQKYPKLTQQTDLPQFCNQQILDYIQTKQFQRVVEIVKFVPECVRVQNIYRYDESKQRKVQYHLRVLIKILLDQLFMVRQKTGSVLNIDEGVINMIQAEILHTINIDDILKVFRVVPKIVQVQKVVQKIVERIIEIPILIPTETRVEKIVEVPKIQEVQKIIHVPVQVVRYVDVEREKMVVIEKQRERLVTVPQVIERIVEKIVEVPKIIKQQIIIEKIIEIQKPTIIQKIIHIPYPEIQQIQIIIQKIIPVQTIIQKPIPTQIFIQKIIPQTIYIPQLVTVDTIREVLVRDIQVVVAKQIQNHIQMIPQIVQIIIQKPVPMIQTIQKIVEVPKIIEKIVEVRVQVPIIQQVKIIQEKIVYRDRIVEVQKIVNHPIQVIHQIQKIVQQTIQIPIIQQRIIRVPQIITQIVIERIHIPKIIEIQKIIDRIIEIPKIIEIQKFTNVYVDVDRPVKLIVEKIVEVPKVVERIKEVRVNIEKIVKQVVEVPKVVEVEKLVEKVVVVPRVVQKIVEVPQVSEIVVDRIIQQSTIMEVQKLIQVPMFNQQIIRIQTPQN